MTSPDDGLISLDDLFAAVGVSASAGDASAAPATKAQDSKDTTEQDLLTALGISQTAALEKRTAAAASVDGLAPEESQQGGSQADRARQWRQELQAAGGQPAAAPVTAAQPAQASVSALPSLSSGSIQPFGAAAQPARIGVLEGSAQPQAQQQPQPVQGMGQPGAGAGVLLGQGGVPFPQQAQGQQQVPVAQGVQQAPRSALQQAQQMPLQPLQPVDAATGSIQPMQQSPLPHQALQQQSLENAPLQPLERASAASSVPGADQAASQQGMQQPIPGSAPQQRAQPFQPAVVAPWQQQMAQQVSAAHAAAAVDSASADAQAQVAPPVQAVSQTSAQTQPQPSAQPLPEQPATLAAQGEDADALQAAQFAQASEMPAPSPAAMASVPEGAQTQQMPQAVAGPAAETVFQQPSFAPPTPVAPSMPAAPPYVEPVIQPPTGEALEDLERGQASSRVAQIVGAILILIATVCVAFAICLLTGVIDLSAINSNPAAQSSSSSDSQLSSQASPSATGSSDGGTTDQPAMTSQSGSKSGQVVYSYVVRGVDGGTHEAMETATFNEDGKLTSSTLEIKAESQMDAEKLLDQLKQEFGESLTEGEATENGVTCTVVLPRDDLDRDSYTELLSTNAPEFKIISQ